MAYTINQTGDSINRLLATYALETGTLSASTSEELTTTFIPAVSGISTSVSGSGAIGNWNKYELVSTFPLENGETKIANCLATKNYVDSVIPVFPSLPSVAGSYYLNAVNDGDNLIFSWVAISASAST